MISRRERYITKFTLLIVNVRTYLRVLEFEFVIVSGYNKLLAAALVKVTSFGLSLRVVSGVTLSR